MFWLKCLIWKARMWLLRRASDRELKRACRKSYRRVRKMSPKITLTCGDRWLMSPQLENRRPTAGLMSYLLATGKVVFDDAFDKKVMRCLNKKSHEEPLSLTWLQIAEKFRKQPKTKEEYEKSAKESLKEFESCRAAQACNRAEGECGVFTINDEKETK